MSRPILKRYGLVAGVVAVLVGHNIMLRFPEGAEIGVLRLSRMGAGGVAAVVAFIVIMGAIATSR